jgi:hypothetical protein
MAGTKYSVNKHLWMKEGMFQNVLLDKVGYFLL